MSCSDLPAGRRVEHLLNQTDNRIAAQQVSLTTQRLVHKTKTVRDCIYTPDAHETRGTDKRENQERTSRRGTIFLSSFDLTGTRKIDSDGDIEKSIA